MGGQLQICAQNVVRKNLQKFLQTSRNMRQQTKNEP
jgi:hypothetical protein